MSYTFQEQMIADTLTNLEKHKKSVLAAGCGAGKTRMAVEIVQKLDLKTLVLCHGLRELRDNMADTFGRDKVQVLEAGVTPSKTSSIHVALPHNLKGHKAAQGYELIVVDEAHQFFFKPMVQAIVKANPKAKLLMLTASHGQFNREEWPVVCRSELELFEDGVILAPVVEIATTSIDIYAGLNAEGDLPKTFKFGKRGTHAGLDSLLNILHGRLMSSRRADPVAFAGTKYKAVLWMTQLFRTMGKTMIACHNIDTAKHVQQYFVSKGVDVALSTSHEDVDPEAAEIQRFVNEPACKILIVINRGILGFNLPALETVIDLTGSEAVDRLYQLKGRVQRTDPQNQNKQPLYLKLVPETHAEWYKYVMSAVMWLAHPENYKNYVGDHKTIRMRVEEKVLDEIRKRRDKKGKSKETTQVDKIKIPQYGDILDVFNRVNWSGGTVGGYAWASLGDVKRLYQNWAPRPDQELIDASLPYTSVQDFRNNDPASYATAKSRKLIDTIVTIRGWTKRKDRYTLNEILESCVGFSSITEWQKAGNAGKYLAMSRTPSWKAQVLAMFKPVNGVSKQVRRNDTGEIFESIAAAARSVNGSFGNLGAHLKGRRPSFKGHTWSYISAEDFVPVPTPKLKATAKPVRRSDGALYESCTAAAKAVGGSQPALSAATRAGKIYYGYYWSYVDEEEQT